MDNIFIKKIDNSMLNSCVDLYIDTFTQAPWFDVFDSRDQVETYFLNHINNNYFLGYALIVDDNIKGLSIGMKKPWINGMEYYIDEFCIDYDSQGQGLGSKFLNLIEDDLKSNDLNAIMLNTEKDFPSFNFYTKNGFKSLDELVILAK